MILNLDCTIEDVQNADTETIYYSFNRKLDKDKREYSLEVYMEMSYQLSLRC